MEAQAGQWPPACLVVHRCALQPAEPLPPYPDAALQGCFLGYLGKRCFWALVPVRYVLARQQGLGQQWRGVVLCRVWACLFGAPRIILAKAAAGRQADSRGGSGGGGLSASGGHGRNAEGGEVAAWWWCGAPPASC